MILHHTIHFAGETLLLNAYRSIYWERERALILSDLHMGKTAHFRKHGIAIPHGIAEEDLNRLKELILFYTPQKVIVVGDLFHSQPNTETEALSLWLNQFSALTWHIVKGNHDRYTQLFAPDSSGIHFTDALFLPPINFVHQPIPGDQPTISGHIHPGVKLRGANFQSIKLPCFLVSRRQIVLPAFSRFTGLDTEWGDKENTSYEVYAITKDKVLKINQ